MTQPNTRCLPGARGGKGQPAGVTGSFCADARRCCQSGSAAGYDWSNPVNPSRHHRSHLVYAWRVAWLQADSRIRGANPRPRCLPRSLSQRSPLSQRGRRSSQTEPPQPEAPCIVGALGVLGALDSLTPLCSDHGRHHDQPGVLADTAPRRTTGAKQRDQGVSRGGATRNRDVAGVADVAARPHSSACRWPIP